MAIHRLLAFILLCEVLSLDLNFQQHEFVVKFERANVVSMNDKYMKYLDVVTFKYNRTWTVMNLTYEHRTDFGNNLEMIIQVYKFASNEYRIFPLRLQANFCDAIRSNALGAGDSLRCGNFTGCPFKKNVRYQHCNFAPDQSRFPPHIPSGSYMAEFQGMFRGTEVFVIKGHASIIRPITV